MLAQSYDFTQRLGDFSDQAKRKADEPQTTGYTTQDIDAIAEGAAVGAGMVK